MSDKVSDTVRRVYRYLYDDGLIEIGVGILFVVVGLGLIGFGVIQDNAFLSVALAVGLLALASVGAFYTKRAQEEVKERITYPRTGYVAYRSDDRSKGMWFVPVAALLLIVISLFLPDELTRTSAMIGALLSVVMASLGFRLKIRRFYALAIIALVAGAASSWLFENEAIGAGLTFTLSGFAMLTSGVLTLLTYLRQHPIVDEVQS